MFNLWKGLKKFFHRLFPVPEELEKLPLEKTSSPKIESIPLNLQSEQILKRIELYEEMKSMLKSHNTPPEVLGQMLLGISETDANYTAQKIRSDEKSLATHITQENAQALHQVAAWARSIPKASGKDLALLTKKLNLDYLKISVASEMAMCLNPQSFLLINKRTLYALSQIANFTHFELVPKEDFLNKLSEYYHRWESYYPDLLSVAENIWQQLSKKNKLEKKYKFFYVEEYCNHIYLNR